MNLDRTFSKTHAASFGARAAFLGAGVGWGAVAWAGPGDHIRVGEATITPRISVGFEHSTNVYHSDDNVVGGTNLHVAPGLDVGVDGPDLKFQLSGDYELRKYFQPSVTSLDRYNDFQVGASLEALRRGPIGFGLSDSLGLRNSPADIPSSDEPFQTQFRNQLDGAVHIRPGSALQIRVGGRWAFDDIQVASGITSERGFNRKHSGGPTLGVDWAFFPRTALLLESSYEFHRWGENVISTVESEASDGLGDELAKPNSDHFRISLGMQGRITEKIVVVLGAGYGFANYDETSVNGGESADTEGFAADVRGAEHLLLDASFRYDFSPTDQFVLGYEKDFNDVFFSNYASYHRVFTRVNKRFGKRFGTAGELAIRYEDYAGEIERQDLFFEADASFSVYINDWADVSIGGNFDRRGSSDADVLYNDFTAYLRSNFVY